MQSYGSILNCLVLVLLACFDTRFGLGFRLGQHADVQLLTEIGPQIETQPLGEPEQRRRHAMPPPDLKVRRKRSTLQNLRSPQDQKVNDPGVDEHAMEQLSKLYKK
ncbi:hypothetical protein B566_EDAN001860, partial [Ephemera danica]